MGFFRNNVSAKFLLSPQATLMRGLEFGRKKGMKNIWPLRRVQTIQQKIGKGIRQNTVASCPPPQPPSPLGLGASAHLSQGERGGRGKGKGGFLLNLLFFLDTKHDRKINLFD